MEMLQQLSDDQLALVGCVAALIFSAGLMWLSHFVGEARRRSGSATPHKQPMDAQTRLRQPGSSAIDEHRQAKPRRHAA